MKIFYRFLSILFLLGLVLLFIWWFLNLDWSKLDKTEQNEINTENQEKPQNPLILPLDKEIDGKG